MSVFRIIVLFLAIAGFSQARSQDQISMKKDSASGLYGWTRADYRHSSGAWMNSFLEIRTNKGDKKEFSAQYAFIIGWDFYRDDACVVIQSQNSHGPYYWQLFDIATGKLLDDFFRSKQENVPSWVKDFTQTTK